jgi:hypothetical protein
MRDAEHAMAQKIESDIFASLDTNKNQTYNSPFVGAGAKYDLSAANMMQVAAGEQEFFFNDVPAIMMGDNVDISRGVYVVGNTTLSSYVNKYVNQGAANAVNLGYQFAPFTYAYSNAFDVTAGAVSSGIAMPVGDMGLLFQNTPDALNRSVAGDGTNWYTVQMPENLLGTNVSVLEKSVCADASANGTNPNGLEATLKVDMQFSVDYYILTPYSSDATQSPYYGFDFL